MESQILSTAKAIISKPDKQVNKIIKIAKYKFGWSRKTIFKFIEGHLPGLPIYRYLSERAIKNYSTRCLFAAMSKADKSYIIKILEQIERRNKINGKPSSDTDYTNL